MKYSKDYAIIIVTFNPDTDTIRYIASLSSPQNYIVVVDNSTKATDFTALYSSQRLLIKKNSNNLGLALALNQGIELAAKENIENFFLFDQDSRIPHNYFHDMIQFKSKISHVNRVICAPNFIDINSNSFATFSILLKWSWKNVRCCNSSDNPLYTNFAITSGTLIDYSTYTYLGPFRNEYFIDHIDSEYCVRAAKLNIPIAINCKCVLKHEIGNRTIKNFFGVSIKPNFHAPMRRYYIARNGTHASLLYFSIYPSFLFLNIARLIHEFISILLYENDKFKKITYLGLGIKDGLLKNFKNNL